MLILRSSLMMAVFWILGDQADGQGTDVSDPTSSSSIPTFHSEWDIPPNIQLDEETTINYTAFSDPEGPILLNQTAIVLCQTSAGQDATINSMNFWQVLRISRCETSSPCKAEPVVLREPRTLKITLERNGSLPEGVSGYYFFCLGGQEDILTDFYCQSYSDFFKIDLGGTVSAPTTASETGDKEMVPSSAGIQGEEQEGNSMPTRPDSAIRIVSTLAYLLQQGGLRVPAPESSKAPVTSIGTTVTSKAGAPTAGMAPSGPTPSVSAPTVSSTKGAGGLSTGAKVGIALGSLIFAALLLALAIFFCIRSRRRRRSRLDPSGTGPEQVMLTNALSGGNNSRDILAEKENAIKTTLIHPNSNDSSLLMHDRGVNDVAVRQNLIASNATRERAHEHETEHHNPPTEQHSNLLTPSSLPSASYTGAAASIPRRKPTTASARSVAVSALSRNTSSATTASGHVLPDSPPRSAAYTDFPDRSQHSHAQLRGIDEEGGHIPTAGDGEQARYGDARHSPQFYSGAENIQAPFLSEPGMSAEEVARLEEEERAIDEAIAAADAARRRERERDT